MHSKNTAKLAYEVDASRESFEKVVEIMWREVPIPTSKRYNATFDEKDLHRSLIHLAVSNGYAESGMEGLVTKWGPLIPSGKIPSTGRAFGIYNVTGYVSSAVGAFAASVPSYFASSLASFHYLYLIYGLVGLLLFIVYSSLKNLDSAYTRDSKPGERNSIQERAKQDISRLSILYGIDAFGGGFVSQSLLSYWFFFVYKVLLGNLGDIFFVVNIITALSVLVAPLMAERIGNLRTMVMTHLISNMLLIAIPLFGSVVPALVFLFLRQSLSQMDVPTRQTFMVEIFESGERVTANALTNTARSIANIFGSPISGVLLSAGLFSLPLISGGLSNIAYDGAIFLSYRRRAQ
jgi:predicted MFS family arabinose efflux permease